MAPHRAQAIRVIHRGGEHLLSLIEGTLDIARIESGKLTLALKPMLFAEYRSPVADAGVPARQVSMAEVLAADVVVVAVPGGAATHHLINAQALSQMQSHAIFVNISRGDVVDEAALIAALSAGQIAGAGLDVYEHEPKVPAALLAMENVTLLPHLGTAALEVRADMGRMAVDNLVAFAAGKPLPNPV